MRRRQELQLHITFPRAANLPQAGWAEAERPEPQPGVLALVLGANKFS